MLSIFKCSDLNSDLTEPGSIFMLEEMRSWLVSSMSTSSSMMVSDLMIVTKGCFSSFAISVSDESEDEGLFGTIRRLTLLVGAIGILVSVHVIFQEKR